MDLPPDSRTALRDWLTEQLADLLGEPLADVRALADDDDLLGCGLDSIRLMYLQERLRARGSTLDFAQLAQRPCLGAWLDLLACADRLSAPATVALPAAQDRDQPFELSSVQQAYWLGRGAGGVRASTPPDVAGALPRRSPADPSDAAAVLLRPAGLAHLAGGRGRARLAGAARLARP